MIRFWRLAVLGVVVTLPSRLQAQDTTKVELRLLYGNPKLRPSLVVLPAPGLDSVRAIVERDLDFSDRYELVPLPGPMDPPGANGVSWAPYRAMNVVLAVDLQKSGDRILVRLWGVTSGQIQQQTTMPADPSGTGEGRLGIHQISDEIVRWTSGSPGVAASRLLYISENRVWRIDSDGYGNAPLTPAGRTAYSPAWAPDGR